jgi:histidine triad (HIT) family protein
MAACTFCRIVARTAPASIVYDDRIVMGFMNIRPVRPGEVLVIPKLHVDRFTDLDDEIAAHLVVIGQRIARVVQAAFAPKRIGYVVSGFGVPHAHLCIVPLLHEHDIVSARHVADSEQHPTFTDAHLQRPRRELNMHAKLIREGLS